MKVAKDTLIGVIIFALIIGFMYCLGHFEWFLEAIKITAGVLVFLFMAWMAGYIVRHIIKDIVNK